MSADVFDFAPVAIDWGTRIKRERIARNWTQSQLAARAGFRSHVNIVHWERGQPSEVLRRFERIADALGYRVEWVRKEQAQ